MEMVIGRWGERGKRKEGREEGETNPFPITILMLLIRSVQIDAIEAADGEREHELDEAEDGVRDVGEGHFEAFEESHVCCF